MKLRDSLGRMELRHLRYFLALAETAHFGRAAQRVHVSQPTLSQQIQQLEEELGSVLFERARGNVRLTPAGELFRVHASRATEDVGAGVRAVSSLRGRTLGLLRVGYLPSLRGLAVPALAAVLRKHPGIRIEAHELVVRRVESRLSDGKLDVGLALASTRAPDLRAEPVFESRLGLLVGKRHPLAGERRVDIHALSDEPFALLTRGLRSRAAVDTYLASTRFSPRIVFESSAVGAILAMVRAGLAVTLLPEPRFADAEQLPIVNVTPAPQSQLGALLYRRDAPESPLAEAFSREIHDLVSRRAR